MLKNRYYKKISNLLRFENGFEIRYLHHFVSKNVPHTTSPILKVTEIQQFRSNQLTLKNRGGPRRKTEKFGQIEKIIGDLYELDNFKQKIFFEKKISKLR